MARYTLFMDWKNQYCQNDYTIQINLQIQCNPYEATIGIIHRTRINNFTICMETHTHKKKLEQPKQSLERRRELEETTSLTSGSTVIKTVWGGGVKMAEEQDGEITFSSTNSSKEQQNGEQSLQSNF